MGRTLGLRCFFFRVLAAETFYAAGGVHELLLARKERVAIGADFYVDVALVGRAGGKAIAARAHDADFVVSGMNGCFHDVLTFVPNFPRNYSILKDGCRIQQMEWPQSDSSGTARKAITTKNTKDHKGFVFWLVSWDLTAILVLGHN